MYRALNYGCIAQGKDVCALASGCPWSVGSHTAASESGRRIVVSYHGIKGYLYNELTDQLIQLR